MVWGEMDTEIVTSALLETSGAEVCRQPGEGVEVFYKLALDE